MAEDPTVDWEGLLDIDCHHHRLVQPYVDPCLDHPEDEVLEEAVPDNYQVGLAYFGPFRGCYPWEVLVLEAPLTREYQCLGSVDLSANADLQTRTVR